VAHRTVRCARPRQPSVGFAPFFLNPILDFLLVYVEPLVPVELIIYSKLVSPIVLCWAIQPPKLFRKRFDLISLSISWLAYLVLLGAGMLYGL
jgi:hypothetical protein